MTGEELMKAVVPQIGRKIAELEVALEGMPPASYAAERSRGMILGLQEARHMIGLAVFEDAASRLSDEDFTSP